MFSFGSIFTLIWINSKHSSSFCFYCMKPIILRNWSTLSLSGWVQLVTLLQPQVTVSFLALPPVQLLTRPFVYLDITELGLQSGQFQPVACSPVGNQGYRTCFSCVLIFPIPQTKNSPCSQSCKMFSACGLSLFTIYFLFTFILAVKDTLIVCKYRQTDYFYFEVTGSDHSRRSQMTFPRATVQACAYFNSD